MYSKLLQSLLFLALHCFGNAFIGKFAGTTFHPPSCSTCELYAKRKFKINTNISGDVSSDGLLTEKKALQEKNNAARSKVESNLGVSPKKKMSSNSGGGGGGGGGTKKLSKKAEKLAKQRNGDVDSSLQAGLAVPEDQDVQIQIAKRGSKQVTIVRGLTSPMEDRKKLLKEIKKKLGGGGSMIEGVVSES